MKAFVDFGVIFDDQPDIDTSAIETSTSESD